LKLPNQLRQDFEQVANQAVWRSWVTVAVSAFYL